MSDLARDDGASEPRGPAFFIRNKKCFVMFLDDHHGDGRLAIWCAAPDGVQAEMVDIDPERFFRPPYVGHLGWLGVQVPGIEDSELSAICQEALLPSRRRACSRWRSEPGVTVPRQADPSGRPLMVTPALASSADISGTRSGATAAVRPSKQSSRNPRGPRPMRWYAVVGGDAADIELIDSARPQPGCQRLAIGRDAFEG